MHITKILLDLKPALDGYAGIPQESRLLFRGLRALADYDIEGLIQHGGKVLRPASPAKGKLLSTSRRIHQHSRMIVSLFEKSDENSLEKVVQNIHTYLAPLLIELRKVSCIPITLSHFESDYFDDFIWQTLFSKTLQPEDKKLISQACYRIIKQSRKQLHRAGLDGLKFFSNPWYVSINTKGFDFFLAQTPFPGKVSSETIMVVRYHDSVPMFMPHTINDKVFHESSHFYALQENVRAGAYFSCISESTRHDLLKIFPEAEPRTSVIHNMVSTDYFDEATSKGLVGVIIRNRISRDKELVSNLKCLNADFDSNQSCDFTYLLMVSTIEPRKNHLLLVSAWERLKYTTMPNLKLVVVGNYGWDQGPVIDAFRPWAKRGDIFHLTNVPLHELRALYKHAVATICPSIAEGFDYSGIEAMLSGGITIASDIPVHREIFQNAADYFNPHSADDAAMVIQRVIANDGEAIRKQLREYGHKTANLYTPDKILPKWHDFFQGLKASRGKVSYN